MKTLSASIVLAAATLALAALLPGTAHADDGRLKFASPSGNVRCVMSQDQGSSAHVNCQLANVTYEVPAWQAHDDDGAPCPGDSGSGRDLRLVTGQAGFVRCSYAALDGGVGPWPSLAYGKSLSLGSLTCDSAPTGVTCSEIGTGHYFVASRDFYGLG